MADPTDVAIRRLGAAAIEFGSYFALTQVTSFAVQGASLGLSGPSTTSGEDAAFLGASLVAMLVPAVYLVVITVVLRGLNGASLGQRLLGLVTVDEAGQPVGFGSAVLRALLGIVDGFPYCCYLFLVGGITMFTSTGHRRVADMVLKTYVVPKEYVGVPLGPPTSIGAWAGASARPIGPWATAVPGQPAAGPQWDAARGAYVQWDPAGQRWMTWDQATNQWMPLDDG